MTTRETAWLIESRFQPRPTWWTGGNNPAPWTRDSLQAVWFCRKQDATAAMVTLPEGHMCFISEHTWELGVEDAEIEALRARVSDLERERDEARLEESRMRARYNRSQTVMILGRIEVLEKALREIADRPEDGGAACRCTHENENCFCMAEAALQGTEPKTEPVTADEPSQKR